MSLSSKSAETNEEYQSSWFGASGGIRLGKLTAARHSCTCTPIFEHFNVEKRTYSSIQMFLGLPTKHEKWNKIQKLKEMGITIFDICFAFFLFRIFVLGFRFRDLFSECLGIQRGVPTLLNV